MLLNRSFSEVSLCVSLNLREFTSLFPSYRFSTLVLEWTLCRFTPSARLMPTSALAGQDVQDQASVTGNIIFQDFHIQLRTVLCWNHVPAHTRGREAATCIILHLILHYLIFVSVHVR